MPFFAAKWSGNWRIPQKPNRGTGMHEQFGQIKRRNVRMIWCGEWRKTMENPVFDGEKTASLGEHFF